MGLVLPNWVPGMAIDITLVLYGGPMSQLSA